MTHTYLRWKNGEPRLTSKGRFVLDAEDTLVQEPGVCNVCEQDFIAGDTVTIMAIGPDSPETVENHDNGMWYSALATVLHEGCSKRGEKVDKR